MKIIRTIPLLLICISFFTKVEGQQTSTYAQYLYNGLAINPAYAGYDQLLSSSIFSRFQSVGLEGSPTTQSFSIHAPIKNNKIGLGLQVFRETIGVSKQTGFYGAYSYKIPFEKFTIAVGLQAGATFYKTSYTQLSLNNPGDPLFNEDINSVKPNFGTGAIIYNDKIFAGISAQQLLSTGEKKEIIQEKPLLLYGAYLVEFSHVVKFKPSMLLKFVNGKAVEWNINANFLFNEMLWVGASLRPMNAATFLIEMQIIEQLSFGYAYDITLNELHKVDKGSHEIMLNYKFRFSKKNVTSPRYF